MGLFPVLFIWHLWFGSGRKIIVLRTCLHFVCFGKLYCQYLRYFELLMSFTSFYVAYILLYIISEIFYCVISTWYEFGIVGLCFLTNFAGRLMAFLLLDLELRLPGAECSIG